MTISAKISIAVCGLMASLGLWAQSPPAQPSAGPGGSNYVHASVQSYMYGLGDDRFWIYEPDGPKPDSADLVVFNHGLGIVNPKIHGAWIKHLVRKGNIVIFPKYQADLNTASETFVDHSLNGILTALDTLGSPGHVKPRLDHFAMIGHSYGGLISTNLTLLADSFGLPPVRALMVAQGYYGNDLALPSYVDFPYDTQMLMILGENDQFVDDSLARILMDSAAVNPAYKNLVTHHPDNHGSPSISAGHEESVAIDNDFDNGESNIYVFGSELLAKTDAVDFFCYWKLADALLSCAFYGQDCNVAFGNTPAQRDMGNWSDGTPVVKLTVEGDTLATGRLEWAENRLVIWPNPVRDELWLSFAAPRAGKFDLVLYDLMGQRLVLAGHPLFFSASSGNRQVVDLGALPSGTYVGQLVGKDVVFPFRFVKLP